MKISKNYIKILLLFIGLVLLNIFASSFYKRFDLTVDKRYTLSDETKNIVESISDPLTIKVYLQGEFPAEFKRIQVETNQFLEELQSLNSNIRFRFINPMSNSKELIKKGLQPSRLTVRENGKVSEAVIFPWAVVNYNGKTANVSLLSNAIASSQEEQLQNSIENLEYEFANALQKVSSIKSKKIAILKGNGELDDINLFSFLKKIGEYYKLAPFTLDSVNNNPQKTLDDLQFYDLAIIAKPTIKFSEKEKLALDQYIMNGGKTIWLIDNVVAELDSLMVNGKSLAFNRDLNLTDLFFSYGVRINYNVTKDIYSSSIRLAAGNTGNKTQYQDFVWHYYPLLINNKNFLSTNLDPILLKFPSSMDTLNNGIKKSVILSSSHFAKVIGTPTNISLDEISIEPIKEEFINANTIFGVLLEGKFKSAYAGRIRPFEQKNFVEQSSDNKMIVISEGDVIANETFKGEPIPLNIDKWTSQPYGNLNLLLNSVQYMLEDTNLLKLRSKKLQIQYLDKEKVFQERKYWQILNIVFPLILLAVFGFIFHFLRKKKYA